MKYLLDTCVLSELVKAAPEPAVLDWVAVCEEPNLFVAALSLAELHRGVARLPRSKRRTALTDWLMRVETGFEGRVLSFSQTTAHAWAEMTARAEARGKPMAAFDSLIAAVALEHSLALVTRNVRDFAATDLKLVNPWA